MHRDCIVTLHLKGERSHGTLLSNRINLNLVSLVLYDVSGYSNHLVNTTTRRQNEDYHGIDTESSRTPPQRPGYQRKTFITLSLLFRRSVSPQGS